MIDKSILHEAIKTFGAESQIQKIIEECLELSLALQKWKNNSHNDNQNMLIVDEIADVLIVIQTATILFDEPSKSIQKRVNFKMNRLKKLLNNRK